MHTHIIDIAALRVLERICRFRSMRLRCVGVLFVFQECRDLFVLRVPKIINYSKQNSICQRSKLPRFLGWGGFFVIFVK